jgi:hypothetical protein
MWLPSLQAQAPVEDVIYLKNGSILRGKVISQEPGVSVTILLLEGDPWTIPQAEIKQVVREAAKYSKLSIRYRRVLREMVMRQHGWYGQAALSVGFYEAEYESLGATGFLRAGLGYRWRYWLGAGLTTGLDIYGDGLIIPLNATLTGDLLPKRVTPTYQLEAGYGWGAIGSWRHEVFEGGLNGQFLAGLKWRTRSPCEWSLLGGFKFQETYQEFTDWPDLFFWPRQQILEPPRVTGNRRYQRIIVQLGLTF